MRFALECFGGLRCGIKHGHIKHFIDTFPEIFNGENEIDIFLLTTKNDWHGAKGCEDEDLEKLKELLGEKLKVIEYFEDQSKEIKDDEDKCYNKWQSLDNKVYLTREEIDEYKIDLKRGIRIRREKKLYLPSLQEALNRLIKRKTNKKPFILETQQGNTFVSRLYYRRMLINNIRKKYQEENNIKYDWVVMCRMFDVNFRKLKELSFFNTLPQGDTIYAAVDHFTAAKGELIDKVYDELGKNYPVVGYEQWKDERYKREYVKFDIGIYYLRSDAAWCSEHQIFWQILKSCEHFVNLRAGCNFKEYITDPDSYFISEFCHDRFS
jgi:hypothetical protein